jgi:hypothetical protein
MPYTDRMPTAGKIVAAIAMAVLAWVASDMVRSLMPPETAFGVFNWVNVVLGCVCGWVVAGKRLGYGYRYGISAGLTGVGALVFLALLVQSFNQMIADSLRRRYEGPFEAFQGMFNIAVDYGQYLLDGPLWMVLLGGGFVIGIIGEWAEQRWQ